MTDFRDLPIRRKVTVIMLATSMTVLFLTGAAFVGYEWLTFRSAALTNLTTVGRIVADNSTAALRFRNEDEAAELLSSLRAESSVVFAGLYDLRGKTVATYPANQPATQLLDPQPAAGHRFYPDSLAVYEPVMQNGSRYGTLVIRLSLEAAYERFALYGTMVLLILAFSSVAAFVLSSRLQARITGPIHELARTAQAIAEKRDFSMRATRQSNDELGALVDSFNHMVSEIRRGQIENQRLNADLERRVTLRTNELHHINNELEAFTYSVSHDLRSPLRHLSGYAQAVKEDPATTLSPDSVHYLDRIGFAADKLSGLVDSLLRLSRIGRQSLKLDVTDLNPVVDAVIADLEPEARGRQIQWQRTPLPPVHCDATLIALVFANLVSNALKYSRPKPVAIIEIGATAGENGTVIFVRDNGVGFDPALQHKLFGVFERLHKPADFEGTGIGLATAHRIVRNHGGRIWAEGRPGEGATFYFSLPDRPSEKPAV